jgi:hypothetical protein
VFSYMMKYTPIRQIQSSACGCKGDSGLSISRHSILENAITKEERDMFVQV